MLVLRAEKGAMGLAVRDQIARSEIGGRSSGSRAVSCCRVVVVGVGFAAAVAVVEWSLRGRSRRRLRRTLEHSYSPTGLVVFQAPSKNH